jgi:hypothetical protein
MPDFAVSEVRYLYEEAIQAGSDHALVVADLNHPQEHINYTSENAISIKRDKANGLPLNQHRALDAVQKALSTLYKTLDLFAAMTA